MSKKNYEFHEVIDTDSDAYKDLESGRLRVSSRRRAVTFCKRKFSLMRAAKKYKKDKEEIIVIVVDNNKCSLYATNYNEKKSQYDRLFEEAVDIGSTEGRKNLGVLDFDVNYHSKDVSRRFHYVLPKLRIKITRIRLVDVEFLFSQ